jgi:hypothetical protein
LDLWPLYESREASPDTQALVDAFVAQDPAFAPTLRDSAEIDLRRPELVPLPPDSRAAIAANFGLLPNDVPWTAGFAVAFWIAFVAKLWWSGARPLVLAPKAKVTSGAS